MTPCYCFAIQVEEFHPNRWKLPTHGTLKFPRGSKDENVIGKSTEPSTVEHVGLDIQTFPGCKRACG